MSEAFTYVPTLPQGYIHYLGHADGDAFAITVDGVKHEFELNSTGQVVMGRHTIPIGVDLDNTASNTAAVMKATLDDMLMIRPATASVHFAAKEEDIDLEARAIAGSMHVGIVQNATRALPNGVQYVARVITADDVAMGRMVVLSQFETISYAHVTVRASDNNATVVNWSGEVNGYGNLLDLLNAGAVPYTAGNLLQVMIFGARRATTA